MEHVTEPKERYNLRKALVVMERNIKILKETDTHILDESTTKQCRIRVLPLVLEAEDSPAPRFFTPFSPENMPEPTAEYVNREYKIHPSLPSAGWGRSISLFLDCYITKLMLQFQAARYEWSCHQIADYKFGDLYRTFYPRFGTLMIWHVAKFSRPHIKCIMQNDLESDDDSLLRGEVLTVIRIMLGQLKRKIFVNDMVAPVLLFSLNRRHPRVIEAYFDGRELLVRRTKAYDFTYMNADGFKTFAQWFMGNPIGDTSEQAILS
ncbi:hypothetical protein BDV25DRAFT_128574 [Aspergillus avenaceus]|uniref:Uncharacterized protein n=1 Tax=Aspergillus avenaceus TaxID=36643 RepID=A0A5N6TZ66_ASPAV|nr:hypothetical protein BDV25DRAFT_128574 [Aspergillus avenaceus]